MILLGRKYWFSGLFFLYDFILFIEIWVSFSAIQSHPSLYNQADSHGCHIAISFLSSVFLVWFRQQDTGLRVCVCPVAQSCPVLCDTMDCSPPGSTVHGIFQARILERVAISYSRGSFPHGSNPCLLHWQADSLPLAPPLFYCVSLYSTSQILHFFTKLKVCGNSTSPSLHQDHFSITMCSVPVSTSYFGNSRNI